MKIQSTIQAGLVFLGLVILSSHPLLSQSLSPIRTNSVVRSIVDDPLLSRTPIAPPVMTTVPRPQPSVRAADILALQKFGKLERELGVIKTNQMMWLEFDSSALFDKKRGSITASGKSLLNKVLNYMALTGSQGIWISYEFADGRESGQTAQIKTENLVEYLKGKSSLSPGCFNLCEPKPLAIPSTINPRLYGQLQRPNQSVVNIRMLR